MGITVSGNQNCAGAYLLASLKGIVILLLLITLSCKEKATQESASFYSIPFAEILKNKREVKLSEIATGVEIIQLENSPEALLGTFENIEFTKDYIFIMCWTQPVLQFSRTGKFIRQIGAIGKGPEEYGWCLNMSVDEKGECIYIQTVESNTKVYNFEGKYIKTIPCPELKPYFWSRDSMLVSYSEPVQGNEAFIFIEHNHQGDTLQGISNYVFFHSNEQAQIPHFSPYKEQNFSYRFKNKLHLKSSYNDTVYTYNDNNRFVPRFNIALGKHKLPEDFIYERKWDRPLPADLCWTGVHETTDFIMLPYGYHFDQNKPESEREDRGLVLFNKETKEGIAVKETKQGGFIDDLTGGPGFRPIITHENTAAMLISALDLKQYLDSDEFKNKEVKLPAEKEKLNRLRKTLKEDDNHFLVMVELKD